ncbi:MAG: AMP-binding protein, partial [Propionibacteriaceae bacterium]|nr:AMP-binding protein [Propionibacteriaceae bacterium]
YLDEDNEGVRSRVRVVTPITAPDEVAALLAGAGTVLAFQPTDDDAIPDGFTGVLVATSGSTGVPKTVLLSRAALVAAADSVHERLGGPGAWANPLPVHYVAGLMTLVRALVAGEPFCPLTPHLDDLRAARGRTYLSLVPPHLHRALSEPETLAKLATYDAILVGGTALDPGLRARAEAAHLRLVETYGASETAGGVVYDGVPLPGVDVRLDPTGRIELAPPGLFDGYLGDPAATADVRRGRWFRTSDRGYLVDGRLHVTGRVDDVVQSGGVNVDLAAIQRLLDTEWPSETACFAVPDPVWGATVLVASAGPGRAAVQARLAGLESAARPRGFLAVGTLPRLASGKIDRADLAKRWEADGDRS